MKRTQAERRAALEAKAKELVDELMAWSEGTARPNLTQIEDEILKLSQALSDLQRGRVPLEALLVAGRLSRDLGDYRAPSAAARGG